MNMPLSTSPISRGYGLGAGGGGGSGTGAASAGVGGSGTGAALAGTFGAGGCPGFTPVSEHPAARIQHARNASTLGFITSLLLVGKRPCLQRLILP